MSKPSNFPGGQKTKNSSDRISKFSDTFLATKVKWIQHVRGADSSKKWLHAIKYKEKKLTEKAYRCLAVGRESRPLNSRRRGARKREKNVLQKARERKYWTREREGEVWKRGLFIELSRDWKICTSIFWIKFNFLIYFKLMLIVQNNLNFFRNYYQSLFDFSETSTLL